ncbi:MAG: DNA methyltransferase [Candidatus Levybacteria bacterium]|nr:DNA methyltransferase [Candidatus Levybacteria bacterium]
MNNLQATSLLNSVKEGDIFTIGQHILGCGKAENKSLLEKMLQARKINLIVTDVPYGCDYVNGKQVFSQLVNQTSIVNDHLQSEQEYLQFTRDWLQAIKSHLSLPNSIYIFNTDKMAFAVKQALEAEGGKFSQLLIWAKNHNVIGRLDYNPQHELIVYGWIGKHEFYKSKDKSVLCYPKPNRSKLHPTMKPVPLLRHLILNSSWIGEVVWDGFGGSGSTMVAAEQTRRICVMTELSPVYCQTIINRMQRIFPEIPISKL